MMFGWESNKTMLRKYMIDHAEDIGRFYADICMNTPLIYGNFMKGFFEELNRKKTTDKKDKPNDTERSF